ncbi:MAG: WD40/YVTN/BNR-like repeat-containing protein, partial [Candidatus Rokuibacteriota bacterium]
GLTSTTVRALAIDPATPATLYAGTPGGGVFKSLDAGATWSPFNPGLFVLFIQALAIDPVTPTTVYAGTLGGGAVQIRQLPVATTLVLGLGLNAPAFGAGDLLVVDLTAANPGPAGFVDVLFGVVLPAAAGPGLGCPAGDAVAFFVETFTAIALSCLSSSPETFAPLFREVFVPAAVPPTQIPAFFSATIPSGLVPGLYVVFIAAIAPEAFLDGSVDPGDLVAVAVQAFTVP